MTRSGGREGSNVPSYGRSATIGVSPSVVWARSEPMAPMTSRTSDVPTADRIARRFMELGARVVARPGPGDRLIRRPSSTTRIASPPANPPAVTPANREGRIASRSTQVADSTAARNSRPRGRRLPAISQPSAIEAKTIQPARIRRRVSTMWTEESRPGQVALENLQVAQPGGDLTRSAASSLAVEVDRGDASPRHRAGVWKRSVWSEPQARVSPIAPVHRPVWAKPVASASVVIRRTSGNGTTVRPCFWRVAREMPRRSDLDRPTTHGDFGPSPAELSASRSITIGQGPASHRVNHSANVSSSGIPCSSWTSSARRSGAAEGSTGPRTKSQAGLQSPRAPHGHPSGSSRSLAIRPGPQSIALQVDGVAISQTNERQGSPISGRSGRRRPPLTMVRLSMA